MRRVLLVLVLLSSGCGGSTTEPPPAADAPAPSTAPPATPPPTASPPAPAPAPLEPAVCPGADSDTCTAHAGRVVTVESVDPDGDGDLHVVATGGSITAPGITVFDVSRALRPARDPRPGDRVTGAGPVFRGSLGQRQIEATTFRVGRVAR